MLNINTPRWLVLALAAALSTAAPVRAQFEFEDDGFEAPADDAPAAAPAADAAPATTADPGALAEFARRDPLVAGVLELPRDTPPQLFRTVSSLIDLGRPEVAALLLPDLLDQPWDAASQAALVREYGSARFMELIRHDADDAPADPAAAPLTGLGEFAQACLDAAAAEATNPARIAQLVAQLQSPSEEDRYAARVDLRATGDAGLVATLHALAVAPTPAARQHLLAALADLRPALDAPLLAALAEGRGQIRTDVATLAGHVGMRAAIPWLAALSISTADPNAARAAQTALAGMSFPTPTPESVQQLLDHELSELDARPLVAGIELRDRWWSWNAATQTPVAADFSPLQLRTLQRARLVRALIQADLTTDPANRRLAVIDALEESALLGRAPAADAAAHLAAMTSADLSASLALAVEHDRYAAAALLAATIGARGDIAVLATPDGRPGALASALRSPVRSLRFAALSAIMQLDPQQPFPGASYVPKALWHFAAGAGEPAAVVAAPVLARASDWAGQLRSLGYEAMPAATGRTAIQAAVDPAVAPRLAVILIDSDIGQPLLREVVYQLHSYDLTAGVPIIIASSVPRYVAAQSIAAQDPLVLADARPTDQQAITDLVERALAADPHPLADADTRSLQAGQALVWLAKLLATDAPYDELRRDGVLVTRALYNPALTAASIEVLGHLGTAASQVSLADYASASRAPLDRRRAAAAALAGSFRRFGIQLTSAQILTQYDRYNASETAGAETQAILSSILDALEKKQ